MGETKMKTEMETPLRKRGESTQRCGSRNGRGRLGKVPHAQSKVVRLFHTHDGKCLRKHLRKHDGSAIK